MRTRAASTGLRCVWIEHERCFLHSILFHFYFIVSQLFHIVFLLLLLRYFCVFTCIVWCTLYIHSGVQFKRTRTAVTGLRCRVVVIILLVPGMIHNDSACAAAQIRDQMLGENLVGSTLTHTRLQSCTSGSSTSLPCCKAHLLHLHCCLAK